MSEENKIYKPEEQQQLEQKTQVKTPAIIEVNERGYLQAKDIDGRVRLAKIMYESKMVPRSYENAQQVFVGMEYAIELGLRPFQGLRNIAIINGNPSIWGDLPLALARKTGELESIHEFIIDKEYNKICFANKNLNTEHWAAVCIIKRKGMDPIEGYFSLDDAQTAGLLSRNKTTPWDTYPKIMLMRRARSMALKIAFPDALSGIAIAEYDFNYLPDGPEFKDVTFKGAPKGDTAKELNGLFTEETKQLQESPMN